MTSWWARKTRAYPLLESLDIIHGNTLTLWWTIRDHFLRCSDTVLSVGKRWDGTGSYYSEESLCCFHFCSGACQLFPSRDFWRFLGADSLDTWHMFAVHQDLCLGTKFPWWWLHRHLSHVCCAPASMLRDNSHPASTDKECHHHFCGWHLPESAGISYIAAMCCAFKPRGTQCPCDVNLVWDAGKILGGISAFLVSVTTACLWVLEGHPPRMRCH